MFKSLKKKKKTHTHTHKRRYSVFICTGNIEWFNEILLDEKYPKVFLEKYYFI